MFRFKLVSISGTKYDGDVYEVVLPTKDGQIGVMSHHMPIVSVATNGVIMVRKNERDQDHDLEYYATNGGVIEVSNNVLNVLVDEADHANDINKAEAEAALDRAKQLKANAKDHISLQKAQELMDRQSIRLEVAKLKHKKIN